MKIIVFLDSHTDIDTIREAVDCVDPGIIIHLGDHISDAIHNLDKRDGIWFMNPERIGRKSSKK